MSNFNYQGQDKEIDWVAFEPFFDRDAAKNPGRALKFLEKHIMASPAGSDEERWCWTKWKQINETRDPRSDMPEVSRGKYNNFTPEFRMSCKANAPMYHAAIMSEDLFAIKPALSWEAAVEWGRLAIEADLISELDYDYLDVYSASKNAESANLRAVARSVSTFCDYDLEVPVLRDILDEIPVQRPAIDLVH